MTKPLPDLSSMVGMPYCICRYCRGRAVIREDFTKRLAAICVDCGAGEGADMRDVRSAYSDGRVVALDEEER